MSEPLDETIGGKVFATDLFEELAEENTRLLNELLFARHLIHLFERFRNCLIDFNTDCICDKNFDNKNNYQLLDTEYQTCIKREEPFGQFIQKVNSYSEYKQLINDQFIARQQAVNNRPKPYRFLGNYTKSGHNVNRVSKPMTRTGVNVNKSAKKAVNLTLKQNIFPKIRCFKNSTHYSTKFIAEKVANNECLIGVHENNSSIKVFYMTTENGNELLGFGCNYKGCDLQSDRMGYLLRHIQFRHVLAKGFGFKARSVKQKKKLLNSKTNLLKTANELSSDPSVQTSEGNRTDHQNSSGNKLRTISQMTKELNLLSQRAENADNGGDGEDLNILSPIKLESEDECNSEDELNTSNNSSKRSKTDKITAKTITNRELKSFVETGHTVDCVDQNNDLINVYRYKPEDDSKFSAIVGYGCKWIGCQFMCTQRWRVTRHIDELHGTGGGYDREAIGSDDSGGDESNSDLVETQSPKKRRKRRKVTLRARKSVYKVSPQSGKKTRMSVKEIQEKIDKNECFFEVDANNTSINVILWKTADNWGSEDMVHIGFGCAWAGCQLINSRKEKIISHINVKHLNNYRFECSECGFKCARKYVFKEHRLLKHQIIGEDNNETVIQFDESDPRLRFNELKADKITGKTYTVEELKSFLKNNQLFECMEETNELIRVFRLNETGESGLVLSTSPIVGFGCKWTDCPFIATGRAKISRHIDTVHKGIQVEMPFHCERCAFKTYRKLKLFEHLIQVHNEDKEEFGAIRCDWPGCTFRTMERFKIEMHRRRHTGEPLPNRCSWPSCDFSSYSPADLRKHMMYHNNIRPFPCEWPGCEWRSRTKNHLKTHMRSHLEEKHFKCEWPACEAEFRSKNGLVKHRQLHTGVTEYVCHKTGCNKKFQDAITLKIHRQVHRPTPQKPMAFPFTGQSGSH